MKIRNNSLYKNKENSQISFMNTKVINHTQELKTKKKK